MRIKISRKESKESAYFLRLIVETNEEGFRQEGLELFDEAEQLKNIFRDSLKNKLRFGFWYLTVIWILLFDIYSFF